MVRQFIMISIAGILFASCREGVKKVDSPISEEVIETPELVKLPGACYMAIKGKDSILMNIVVENNTVAGHLHYRFSKKDKSGGILFGVMRGDTLVADYKFIAEGTESEREVAFLKRGNDFIEGYGDAEERDGRVVFKKIASLKFEGWPMQPLECAEIVRYFKK